MSGIRQMIGILQALTDKPLMMGVAGRVAGLAATRAHKVVSDTYVEMADSVRTDGIGALFDTSGKDPGAVRPARLPHAPGETYRRLAGSIRVSIGGAHAPVLALRHVGISGGRVAPDPSPKYPEGTPLEVVDSGINGPARTMSYLETIRSTAYSIMVKEGRGGYGMSKGTGRHMPEGHPVNARVIVTSRGGKEIWKNAEIQVIEALTYMEARDSLGTLYALVRVGLARGAGGKK